MKIIFEKQLKEDDIEIDDGGMAKILTLYNAVDENGIPENTDSENGIHVDVVSWDEEKKHNNFHKLEGKRVRITIETIE